jgi:Ca2+-binding EF-hand superfamily protein
MRAITVMATVVLLLPAAAFAQGRCNPSAESVVDAIFRQVLERPVGGDGTELAAQLSAGRTSVQEIVRAIAKSEEHRRRFMSDPGPNGRVAAVTALYQHLLARAPDDAGLRSHLQAAGDLTRIVDVILASPEYQRRFGADVVPGAETRYCPDQASNREAIPRAGVARFGGMDRDDDGRISRDEWNGSRNSFEVHDWNNDGVLSGDEVRHGAWRPVDEAPDYARDGFVPWRESSFDGMDRNRDGRISSAEWYYEAEYFRRADRNRDGTLSRAEFSSPEWDDDRDDRFEYLDRDGDGQVARSEWHGSTDAFDWLDRDRNNVLSRGEVVGEESDQFDSFASLDVDRDRSLSPDEWRWSRASFDRVDTNRDGVISRREFLRGGQ